MDLREQALKILSDKLDKEELRIVADAFRTVECFDEAVGDLAWATKD